MTKTQALAVNVSDSNRIDGFLRISKEWFWELDRELNIAYSSQYVDDLLGFSPQHILGMPFISLLCEAEDSHQQAAIFFTQQLQKGEAVNELVACFRNNKQELQYLEVTAVPFYDKQHRIAGYHGLARDISKQYKLEKTLHNLADGISAFTGDSFFRSLVTHIAKLLKVDYALVGEFTGENRELVNVLVVHGRGEITTDFSYPLKGTPCEEVFDGDTSVYIKSVQSHFPDDVMLPDMKAEAYLGAPLFSSDNSVNGILAIIHSTPFENPDYLLSIFRLYVTRAAAELERRQANQLLEKLAHHDELTGLCNRSLLMSLLENSLTRSRRNNKTVALLFLDLDRFKNINDTMGHDTGDKLLIVAAERLNQCVREDDIVARIGGDEFIIVLNELVQASDSIQVADKIIEQLSKPISLDDRELLITTSIGISVYPKDGTDSSTLLKNADIALYRAKEYGRDQYQFYSSDMGDAVSTRINLEHDLKSALKNNQFEIYYQPKINHNTMQTIGVEALLRWHHPTQGTISPVTFIPLLEETGDIVSVGDWVLRMAMSQCQQWNEKLDSPISVAVNLSARQFRKTDMFSQIKAIVEKLKFPPSLLELEITESILIEEGAEIAMALQRLRESGVRIALDDFGTGYSSLSYLRKFPISTLKVDKSFIQDIAHDDDAKLLTQAIVSLAKTLDLEVIAEGVETKEQLSVLQDLNCELIQGYYFARPMNADDLYAFVASK